MRLSAYPAVLALVFSAGAAASQSLPDPTMGGPGDAAHGEVLFKQRCMICHQAEKGGKNGLGPALYGVYGSKTGQAPGFAYSAGVKAGAFIWTADKLNLWLQKPAAVVPGAKMVLAPVTAPQDRSDIIAYLQTKSTVGAAAAPAAKPKANKKS